MDRSWINYWVDIGILINFIVCGITGIVKMPKLIPMLGLSYSDLPMAVMSWLHDWSGVLLVLLSALHIILHWRWIMAMTKRIGKNESH
jgi:hypothetical protein